MSKYENTLTCKDFSIGDIVKMIKPELLNIKKGAIGKVTRIGDTYITIIWLNIELDGGGYYPYRFKKITKEEAVLELL